MADEMRKKAEAVVKKMNLYRRYADDDSTTEEERERWLERMMGMETALETMGFRVGLNLNTGMSYLA